MMLDGRRMMLPTEEIGMRACLEGSAQNLFKHVVNTLSVIHSAMLHVVHGFLIPCSLGDIFSLGIMHSIVSLKRMTQRWLFVMHVLSVAGVDNRYSAYTSSIILCSSVLKVSKSIASSSSSQTLSLYSSSTSCQISRHTSSGIESCSGVARASSNRLCTCRSITFCAQRRIAIVLSSSGKTFRSTASSTFMSTTHRIILVSTYWGKDTIIIFILLKTLGFGAEPQVDYVTQMTQRWLFVMHVLGVAGIDYRYSVTINCVSKVPLVSIGHVVFFPSHHRHYAYSQSYRTYGGTF